MVNSWGMETGHSAIVPNLLPKLLPKALPKRIINYPLGKGTEIQSNKETAALPHNPVQQNGCLPKLGGLQNE